MTENDTDNCDIPDSEMGRSTDDKRVGQVLFEKPLTLVMAPNPPATTPVGGYNGPQGVHEEVAKERGSFNDADILPEEFKRHSVDAGRLEIHEAPEEQLEFLGRPNSSMPDSKVKEPTPDGGRGAVGKTNEAIPEEVVRIVKVIRRRIWRKKDLISRQTSPTSLERKGREPCSSSSLV